MCGRFTLRAPASVIAEQFALFEVPLLKPRFNIAPTQPVPVIRMTAQQAQPQRQFVFMHWGLVPSWADDPAIGNRMINARAETAAEKPSFRTALRRRRCLIVADGFYEWQTVGKRRQPMFIHMRDDQPLAFAGLWESWEGANHSALESCTILTTAANDVVRPIHDRMPAILAPEDYGPWLDPAVQKPEPILPLLRPYPSASMEAYPVSAGVNSPARDDERCLERMGGEMPSDDGK
ncbi:MAG: SOS response-associated peptidase [Thermoguttaceae bacterium]